MVNKLSLANKYRPRTFDDVHIEYYRGDTIVWLYL